MQLTDSSESCICFFMDNVYQPPQANLQPDDDSGAGTFSISRAFSLATSTFGKKFGLALGILLLMVIISFVTVFAVTLLGVIFRLTEIVLGLWIILTIMVFPVFFASYTVIGYRLIRREASVGDLFLGFRSYGSTLVTAISLFILYYIITIPFSIPQMLYLFEGFPTENVIENMPSYMAGLKAKQEHIYDAENIWRVILGYIGYLFAFYFWGRVQMVLPLVILRESGIGQAFKSSWQLTGPHHLKLALYLFLVAIVMIIGFAILAFGIALSALTGSLAIILIPACVFLLLLVFAYGLILYGAATYQLFGDDTQQPAPQ